MQPDGCICPTESYWCRADLVTTLSIGNSTLSDEFTYVFDFSMDKHLMKDGLTVSFSEERMGNGLANLTAQLFIVGIQTWNGSIISCRAQGGGNKSIRVCVTGKIVSV